ncbi:MAG: 5'-methylthioadenosine/adenosylhomocysteine nucleosidase [Clostridia bacterium]|nr:5'-methylthioadenosine/adenosylhomocysteine nucleosidase [Clostridia bacterium]
MIGIIGAMQMEVENIVARMTNTQVRTVAGMDFTQGELAGVPCVVVQCGAGKVNAAMCAQALILEYHPDKVINIGVAGGIGPNVHIGDLVVATHVVQYDFDTTAMGEPLAYLPRINQVEIPCDEAMSATVCKEAPAIYSGTVHSGCIATGDKFVADGAFTLELNRLFGAMACEMEGGSIGHVCYLNNVPFTVLRAISDNANDEGSVDFMTFARESAVKSQQLLEKVIPLL